MCLPRSYASTSYEQVQTHLSSVCRAILDFSLQIGMRMISADRICIWKAQLPCCARHYAKCFANIISKLTKISKSPGMLYNIWSFHIFTGKETLAQGHIQLVSFVETKQYASESVFWPHFDVLFACNMLSVFNPPKHKECAVLGLHSFFKRQVSYFFFSGKKRGRGRESCLQASLVKPL